MPNNLETFNKIKEDFDTTRNEVDIFNKNNIEASPLSMGEFLKKVDNAIKTLRTDLLQLEVRRQKLIHKPTLSKIESEELDLLQEIARDVKDLGTLIEDYKGDQFIPAETILQTGNLQLIISQKDRYNFSVPSIFEAMKYGEYPITTLANGGHKDLKLISTLKISDQDIEELISEKDNTPIYNIYLLLKYATLTETQKINIYSEFETLTIGSEDNFVNNRNWISLALTTLTLPTKFKEKIITSLQNYAKAAEIIINADRNRKLEDVYAYFDKIPMLKSLGPWMDGSIDQLHDVFFQFDILSNESLTTKEKQAIAKLMLKFATGLESSQLLEDHLKLFSTEDQKILEQKIQNDPFRKNLSIKPLKEVDPKLLKGKKINIIVHPHFDVMYKPGNDGFEQSMIESMRNVINRSKVNKGKTFSSDFISIYFAVKQNEYMKKAFADTKKFTIIVFPRGDSYSQDSPQLKYFARITKNYKNVAYIESDTANSGSIKPQDMNYTNSILDDDAEIEGSGGYLGACLTSGMDSLNKLQEKRRITINHNVSAINLYSSDIYPESIPNMPKFNSDINPEDIKSYDDVLKIIDRNKAIMDYFIKKNLRDAKLERGSDPNKADFYSNLK